jgi:hypothetical protein
MSKDTSTEDSNQSSKTWKAQVTIQRGEYSQRKKLAHLTKGNASSSWATPNTMDSLPQRSEEALKRQATTTRDGRAKPANLREQVNERSMEIYAEKKYPLLFPTPTATPYGNNQGGAAGRTPRASEYKDCGPVGSKSHTHMDKKNYLCAKTKQEDKPTGCLNPTWVEWLMGVPTGWTELDSWAMELSPKQPPEHGRS